jgi:hypothetical protein
VIESVDGENDSFATIFETSGSIAEGGLETAILCQDSIFGNCLLAEAFADGLSN